MTEDARVGQVSHKPCRHVAIIMDGNGRWAELRRRPRLFGHHMGAKRVKEIVRLCPDLGVEYITIFAFSTENWIRSEREISGLMAIFRQYIRREANEMLLEGVRMRFIGDRERLDPKLQKLMSEVEALTASNSRVNFTIAINYGSRDEVTRAARQMAFAIKAGELDPKDVDVEILANYLDTKLLPDPDLVIRTSGEARVSNFLLWQSAYAEYEFVATLWPDFTPDQFKNILSRFSNRERRFGGVAR